MSLDTLKALPVLPFRHYWWPPDSTLVQPKPVATLTPSALSGASVTFTASADVFTVDDIGKMLWKKPVPYNSDVCIGRGKIVGFIDAKTILVDILEPFDKLTGITSQNWFLLYDQRLDEICRITRTAPINLDYVDEAEVWSVMNQCDYANDHLSRKYLRGPKIGIKISALHWNSTSLVGYKDTDSPQDHAIMDGWMAWAEDQVRKAKLWIDKHNQTFKPDIQVGAINIDCEQWQLKNLNEADTAAFMALHQEVWDFFRTEFPNAFITRYGRGPIATVGDTFGLFGELIGNWNPARHYDGTETKGDWSPVMYHTINPAKHSAMMEEQKTLLAQDEYITPWITIGCGYSSETGTFKPGLEYDVTYDEQRADLRNGLYKGKLLKSAIIYPGAYDPDIGDDNFEKHLGAYVNRYFAVPPTGVD